MDTKVLPNVSALESGSHSRHRWYFFKEGFSPALVNHAIEDANLNAGALVFDPFAGSGTTPLEAGLAGMRGVGTEVNPFLRFVAETKASTAPLNAFDDTLADAIHGALKGSTSPLTTFSTFTEKAEMARARGKWLFNSEVLSAFEGGLQRAANHTGAQSDLIKLCLIGAAMDSANAAKDGKCLRYKNGWADLRLGADTFLNALDYRAAMVRKDLESTAEKLIDATVALGDSRNSESGHRFDLCVTSPPYLNSFDYTDIYRPELFLGRFIKDMATLRALRLKTLRSHVQAAWADPTRSDFGLHYSKAMVELRHINSTREPGSRGLWNGRLPVMVQAYFEDMERVITGLRKLANPTASVWLVVSTSAYAGVEFPVDLIIADIAGRCGWYLREVTVLRYLKRVAGQQWGELSQRDGVDGPHLRESLVILDVKPHRARM